MRLGRVVARCALVAGVASALVAPPSAGRRRVCLAVSEESSSSSSSSSSRTTWLSRVGKEEEWSGSHVIGVAVSEAEFERCGALCAACFPSSAASQHTKVLRNPGSLSNVFFDAASAPSVACVSEAEEVIGCAQVVPCVVRGEATEAAGGRGFWVQYVCVAEKARRRGVATALMAWCEREAGRAAAASRAREAEVWLAARQENAAALELYSGLGFEAQGAPRRGHVVMRKTVPSTTARADEATGPAASFDVLSGDHHRPWEVVADLVGPSVLFAAVGALGASTLVAPFFYRTPSLMARSLLFGDGLPGLAADLAVGLAAALAAELLVARSRDDAADVLDELSADASLASQKLALWRITSGATADAAFQIALWQLVASAAEEIYYRALLLNGAKLSLAALGLPDLAAAAAALALSTALFSLAHAAWVAPADDRADAARLDWLAYTAPFGLLFGALFLLQHDRILAPLLAHWALNTYWSLLDADKLRHTRDRQALASLFHNHRLSLL